MIQKTILYTFLTLSLFILQPVLFEAKAASSCNTSQSVIISKDVQSGPLSATIEITPDTIVIMYATNWLYSGNPEIVDPSTTGAIFAIEGSPFPSNNWTYTGITPNSGDSFGYSMLETNTPFTLTATFTITPQGGQAYMHIACYSTSTSDSSASDISSGPPDNRLNYQYGDAHIAIVYPTENGIDLYLYDDNTYLSNFVHHEDIVAGFIKNEGPVTLHVQDDMRIIITIGPDDEGKVYTISMDDLKGENFDAYYYDPRE